MKSFINKTLRRDINMHSKRNSSSNNNRVKFGLRFASFTLLSIVSYSSLAATANVSTCTYNGTYNMGYSSTRGQNQQAVDGTGTLSTVAGCGAYGGEENLAVTVYGSSATAGGEQASAFGTNAKASSQATAIGTGSISSGTSSTALGSGATATGDYGVAIGSNANGSMTSQDNMLSESERLQAAATGSVAIGSNSTGGARVEEGADNSIAIGAASKATAKNAAAIGANSIADVENTVSIGSSGAERKLVNLADGTISETSTDAVNGSQLFATNENVATNATNIANTNENVAQNTTNIRNISSQNTYNNARIDRLNGRVSNVERKLDRLDQKVDKGFAANAALAGLFQPYGVGKVNITAGIGGYRSESAVAVGVGYRMNEKIAFKGGVASSTGSGSSPTYNAAINFEW